MLFVSLYVEIQYVKINIRIYSLSLCDLISDIGKMRLSCLLRPTTLIYSNLISCERPSVLYVLLIGPEKVVLLRVEYDMKFLGQLHRWFIKPVTRLLLTSRYRRHRLKLRKHSTEKTSGFIATDDIALLKQMVHDLVLALLLHLSKTLKLQLQPVY